MATQQELDLIIKAKADVNAGFAQVKSRLAELGNAVQKSNAQTSALTASLGKMAASYLTIGAVVKAAGVAVQFLSDSLKAQSQHQEAVNQLNLALANQGKFAKVTSDALVDYAAKIQATTTFNDEAVIAAESLLVTFGLNEAQIQRTTAAAADLSVRTGKDLTESAQLLGKAFAGNTTALGKLGFHFTDGASKAQKYAEALEQVESRFGGAAATQTKTFEGQLKQLANAWDEVKESTGLALGAMLGNDKQFGVLIKFLTDTAELVGKDLPYGWALLRAQFMETVSSWSPFMNAQEKAAIAWEAQLIRAKATLAAINYGKFAGSAPPNAAGGGGNDRDLAEEQKAADARQRLWEKAFAYRAAALKRAHDMEIGIINDVAQREGEVAQGQAERSLERARLEDALYKERLKQLRDLNEVSARWERIQLDRQAGVLDAFSQNAKGVLNLLDAFGVTADSEFGKIGNLFVGTLDMLSEAAKRGYLTIGDLANQAAAIYKSGSAAGGAASGALTGTAILPGIGTAIGAVAGGLLGAAGAAKKNAEAVRQLREQLLAAYDGMDALQKKAQQLGVDIGLAFSTKDPKLLQSVINLLNQAIEDQKKRIEGLATATSGLDKLTQAWASNIEKATIKDAAAFNRLGTYALAVFAGIVKETGNAIAALDQIGPSLDRLIEAQKKFGLTASDSFKQLLFYRKFFTDNKAIADSLSGLGDIMAGLDAAGIHSQTLFNSFGKDLVSIFNQMKAKGLTATQSLAFMQPQLQQLWEAQKNFGYQTDQATQSLLTQAEQQGLVGENMRSVNDKILQVLVAIAEVLGADLPDALKTMGDAAEEQFGRFKNAAGNAANAVPNVPGGGDGGGGGGGGGNPYGHLEGNAYGNAYVPAHPPYGQVRRIGEREAEHVLTNPQLENAIARGIAMAGNTNNGGGGPQTLVTNVMLDGNVLARVISQRTKDGRFRIHESGVRGY